jgi:phosphoserine phosphatase
MEYHAEDPVAKVNQVKEICKMYNCSPKETFFVGDSNNDLYAFDLTKHGILYKSKDPDCVKHAWKTIEDLREIKNI